MKKLLMSLLLVISFVSISYAGGVTDDNNGNKGNIFVSTGQNNGGNSVGTWVDPKDVPELKGEKGDKGDKGDPGATGATGEQGIQGIQGEQGVAGENGVDGKDGLNGIDGAKGDTGDKGDTGEQGVKGDNGKDVDPNTVNNLQNQLNAQDAKNKSLENKLEELEATQYIVGAVIRVKETKKWNVDLFADYNTGRSIVDRTGIRFTYKFGKGYTEKRMDELEAKIKALE